jgi:hypothetical protein
MEETTTTARRGKQKNLRLSDEGESLLVALASSLGVNQTAVMEMAIRRMARAEGVTVEKGAEE